MKWVRVDGPGRISIAEEGQRHPGREQVKVRTLVSAISSGTECRFIRGEHTHGSGLFTDRDPIGQKKDFPFSIGYSLVGRVVEAGSKELEGMVGCNVFAYAPHQTSVLARPSELVVLPRGMDPLKGSFISNMETAASLLMDGRPMVGEEVLVIGQGVVGLLLTKWLSETGVSGITTVEKERYRREGSLRMGAARSVPPEELDPSICSHEGFDLVFEVSGSIKALETAVKYCGYSGRLVIGSYYGEEKANIRFGDAFHRKRLRIMSSQVSSIDPTISGRWDRKRRTELVLDRLKGTDVEDLITHRFRFEEAGDAYSMILSGKEDHLQVLLEYQEE